MGRVLKTDSIRLTAVDKNGYQTIEVNKMGKPLMFPVMVSQNQIMPSGIDKIIEIVKDQLALV